MIAQIAALREGREPPQPADELSRLASSLLATMTTDPDLFRAGLEYVGTITPIQQIFARPGVAQRVRAVMDAAAGAAPIQMPGPDRAQLLDLVR